MKRIVSGITFAATLALACVAADAPAPSPHEKIRRQLETLQAKPVKAELPPYLAPEDDFENACQRAAQGGKRVVVSIGREACGRCQVFYEYVKRGELKIDKEKFAFIRLDIDDASQRSYFLSTFTPADNNLPFVGVMNGERDALSPCMTGGHTAAEYAKMLNDVLKGKDKAKDSAGK